MEDTVVSAIEVFKGRVKDKEAEVSRLKKAVNEMCQAAGLPPVYAGVESEHIGNLASIRSDHFYGQGLSTAIRIYLELRKASGLSAASVNEIYDAVKGGGYKFDTKDEENAKTSVRATLRKNTAQFHRLPNGEYGLLSWYPAARPSKNGDDDEKPVTKPKPKAKDRKKSEKAVDKSPLNGDSFITNDQIRDAVAQTNSNFQVGDIEVALKANFPSKTIRLGAVPTVLYALKKIGKLKLISERRGNQGATYCKA